VFVMTSNYPPSRLYPDGLKRENFIPTIKLLEHWLDIVEVDGGIDYRLRTLEQVQTFLVPDDARAQRTLDETFDAMVTAPEEPGKLMIEGRPLTARRRAGSL